MLKPGEFAPVPTSKDELLISALRHANQVSGLLNDLTRECHKAFDSRGYRVGLDRIHELLLRQHSDCSGLHLFIAAGNIGLELPPDLRCESDEEAA